MAKSGPKSGKKSNEEIFAGFQALRTEQRQIGSKISELQMDLNEHKWVWKDDSCVIAVRQSRPTADVVNSTWISYRIVIETLRGVETSRKCFRMVGGVLVERTVADVLPELENNCTQLPKAVQALENQLAKKGEEINKYIEQHDIRIQRADRAPADDTSDQPTKSNVLVASGWFV